MRPKSTFAQASLLLLLGAGAGLLSSALTSPDFDAALAQAEEASSDEIKDLMDDASQGGSGSEQAEIPVPRKVAFDDVMGLLFGQPGVTFIDARDAGTFEAGHIPGSLLIDAEQLDRDANHGADVLQDLPKSEKLVIYCSGGNCDLSMRLARSLIARGFSTALVYEGGWSDWQSQGGPVESGPMKQGGDAP